MKTKILSFLKQIWNRITGNSEKHFRVRKLPIRLLGLTEMPAVPLILRELPGTLLKLGEREKEMEQAKNGLYNTYKIDGETATAYSFMYSPSGLTAPRQAREKLHDRLNGPGMVAFVKDQIVENHLSVLQISGI